MPNPASGNAKLVFNSFSQLPVEMEIIDMSGKTYKKMKSFMSGTGSFDFSVKDLTDGIYIMKARQGNKWATAKFIVNRKK